MTFYDEQLSVLDYFQFAGNEAVCLINSDGPPTTFRQNKAIKVEPSRD